MSLSSSAIRSRSARPERPPPRVRWCSRTSISVQRMPGTGVAVSLYRSVKGSFTQEFIRTTIGWNANWVNDRIYPRRPFIYALNANAIDNALKEGKVLQYVRLHDLK